MCECVAHAQSPLVSLAPAGHRHVSVRRPLPLSLHVHGSSRRRLLCRRRLLVSAPAPLPERSAAPTQVQPLLPAHGGAGQHAAHHRSALHGWRRHGAEGGGPGGSEPRPVRGYPGFHVGGDQPLVRDLLRLRLHVAQNVRGQGLRQRAAEYPTSGQRTRLESGQSTERLAIGAHETYCIFVLLLY